MLSPELQKVIPNIDALSMPDRQDLLQMAIYALGEIYSNSLPDLPIEKALESAPLDLKRDSFDSAIDELDDFVFLILDAHEWHQLAIVCLESLKRTEGQ
jgi:hypothetical protein